MSDRLRAVQSDMAFMGWKGDPASGFSHKVDVDGHTIARAHDDTWRADVAEAEARAERLEIIAEAMRRAGQPA